MSGGVDSSYIVYLAKKYNLRPLLLHFDNGWNSELAVSNIKKITNSCGFDLQTYVVNWSEFRNIQRSFIKSGVRILGYCFIPFSLVTATILLIFSEVIGIGEELV